MMDFHKHIKEIGIACLGLAMAVSCGDWGERMYHHSKSVPIEWTQNDTVSFPLPVLPEGKEFNVCVDVYYTDKYHFQNLWLLVRHNIEDSLRWQTDTLCCTLYNNDGLPLGKGFAGLYQIEVPLKTLQADGSCVAGMQIMHCMTDDSLKGVMDVGIKVSSISE